MGRLISTSITSLDGYINDEQGKFDWGVPDPEVHAFVNDLERPIGTYLYGRRLYDVMTFWETAHEQPGLPAVELDYARLWQAADKIVYSTTLAEPSSARTRVERSFDAEAVRALKESSDRDLTIGGPGLAAHALRAGLIDEIRVFLSPVIVGGGTHFLADRVRLDLDLTDERRFANGVVYLAYRVTSR
ncbi:dihydrofolate reductase family protein [Actinoplanes sp. NPDC089786]|uniref:dihydrofolate reductase family protein n=1 Tax=Actinoplanes sp. NPDC089786 TaxID=3155185 RepID=UPI003435C8C7